MLSEYCLAQDTTQRSRTPNPRPVDPGSNRPLVHSAFILAKGELEHNITGLKSQLAGDRPVGYLQAWPSSWTWGYRETTAAKLVIACLTGVERGGKGERRARKAWEKRAGLEPAHSGFQVRAPNRSAMLPPLMYPIVKTRPMPNSTLLQPFHFFISTFYLDCIHLYLELKRCLKRLSVKNSDTTKKHNILYTALDNCFSDITSYLFGCLPALPLPDPHKPFLRNSRKSFIWTK